MDALSALKMTMGPQLGVESFNPAQQAGAAGAAAPVSIPDLDKLNSTFGSPSVASVPGSDSSSFSNLLGNFVNEVSDKQASAGDAVNGLLSGKNVSLHQAMISMEEASVSFQMMVEVRNKLLDSYQELMRMQV